MKTFSDNIILVVDDEKDICDIMKFHFEQLGAEVYTARGSKEALSVLVSHYVDIIISDINMAEVNGLDFLEMVKERRMHRRPFFLMSGHRLFSKAEIDKLGAKDFFPKPLEFEIIDKKLALALGL